MTVELKVKPQETEVKGKCHHYWIIEPPGRIASRGVCKLCGAEKDFINDLPHSYHEGEIFILDRSAPPKVGPAEEPEE